MAAVLDHPPPARIRTIEDGINRAGGGRCGMKNCDGNVRLGLIQLGRWRVLLRGGCSNDTSCQYRFLICLRITGLTSGESGGNLAVRKS